ncbi:MAG TPA: transcription termination/antitermination protein NusA, partial [Solirubrobacterales bacterium]|nr:transcription termination/antitermination protein NusA [Solirubrobacterales bacterium]
VEDYEGEEQSDGHCMAVLSNGRRCPNAAIGDSHYCGLPTHQALARFDTNQIAVLSPLEEAEVAILADRAADGGQVSEIVAKAEAEFEEAQDEGSQDAGSVAEAAEADVPEDGAEEPVAEEAEQA